MGALEGIVAAFAVLAMGWLLLAVFLWFHRPARDLARPAIRLMPDVVRLVRALLADTATPRSVRVALTGLLAYLMSPLDLIPDLVPVIGYADDLIVTAIVLRWAGRRVGVECLRAKWTGTTTGFALLCRLLGLPL